MKKNTFAPHPFTWLAEKSRPAVFRFATFFALFVFANSFLINQPLVTEAAPAGIVSFEFAWTLESAQAMIASWGDQARVSAAFGLGVDYLLMPAYALALGLGVVLAVPRFSRLPRLAALGPWLAWGQILAAGLDSIENYALIRLVFGAREAYLAPLAGWCALFKFSLLLLGLGYVLLGLVQKKG